MALHSALEFASSVSSAESSRSSSIVPTVIDLGIESLHCEIEIVGGESEFVVERSKCSQEKHHREQDTILNDVQFGGQLHLKSMARIIFCAAYRRAPMPRAVSRA